MAAFDRWASSELEIIAKRQTQQEHEHEIDDSLRRRCRLDLPRDIDRAGAVVPEEHLDRRLEDRTGGRAERNGAGKGQVEHRLFDQD